ncbi:phosphoribosyltransferase [Stenotrophomonas maltophilia]|uniref:phosphoribosyltransferase n=1 Tax=Stenotrophomonas maltophilia TaxID=40324 RepID=UPI0015DE020E|nr:phosphoribosyltransferase [Stenotrophomonas maltophilia]MBA0420317.1 phosphoribosyltransferase [Stenotrophomonas maltophilia]
MRLQILEPRHHTYLVTGDRCWHYGEYTSEGGYQASDTNQKILNLKKKPTVSEAQLYYKSQAIDYWGRTLARVVNLAQPEGVLTFVPMPGSKPIGHAEYDDRMLRVLRRMAAGVPNVDIRPLLVQTAERDAQHHGHRLTPDELCETLAVDSNLLNPSLARTIVVVDDVITMGASFAAAKRLLVGLPNVSEVVGVFLAKTVWPAPAFPVLTAEQIQQLLASGGTPAA